MFLNYRKSIVQFAVLTCLLVGHVSIAKAYQTTAAAAIIIDHGTRAVLFEKDADVQLPPASMSKLMTIYMVFEALEMGRIGLQDMLPVSSHAVNSVRGSTMFLDTRDRVSVEDLIRGVVVLSGNDACIVLAEALSPDGSEAGFARTMNERAIELGLTNSHFVNASGWPHPEHLMSARDLATLTARLIDDFPQYYGYFSESEFRFDNRAPENRYNRNPLLRREVPGADGLKTGYTSESRYGIVGSGVIKGSRVIFVLNGIQTRGRRAVEAEGIIGWYTRNFDHRNLYTRGEVVVDAPVWLGESDHVPVVAGEDVRLLLPIESEGGVMVQARFERIVEAPVQSGQHVGVLQISVPDLDLEFEVPLLADADVQEAGILKRASTALGMLVDRYILELVPSIL